MGEIKEFRNYTQSVEDLEVFRRAFEVSVEIHKATLVFPKIEQYALADQFRRSSKSVCANIAKGYAKQSFSKPEFQRFLGMAIASAAEVRVWIAYAVRLEYVNAAVRDNWKKAYESIEKMLGKLRYHASGAL